MKKLQPFLTHIVNQFSGSRPLGMELSDRVQRLQRQIEVFETQWPGAAEASDARLMRVEVPVLTPFHTGSYEELGPAVPDIQATRDAINSLESLFQTFYTEVTSRGNSMLVSMSHQWSNIADAVLLLRNEMVRRLVAPHWSDRGITPLMVGRTRELLKICDGALSNLNKAEQLCSALFLESKKASALPVLGAIGANEVIEAYGAFFSDSFDPDYGSKVSAAYQSLFMHTLPLIRTVPESPFTSNLVFDMLRALANSRDLAMHQALHERPVHKSQGSPLYSAVFQEIGPYQRIADLLINSADTPDRKNALFKLDRLHSHMSSMLQFVYGLEEGHDLDPDRAYWERFFTGPIFQSAALAIGNWFSGSAMAASRRPQHQREYNDCMRSLVEIQDCWNRIKQNSMRPAAAL